MTPKEAIKKIQARIDTDFLNGEPFPTELEMAIEVLEKQAISEETSDKYRWHDLRKNPEDLPNLFTDEDTEAVLVIDDLDEYHTAYYNYHFREWLSDTNYKFEVIAWREIEPFEVE